MNEATAPLLVQPICPACRHRLEMLLDVLVVVERHRRHIELSPGVGLDAQQYGLAVCNDILNDLADSSRKCEHKWETEGRDPDGDVNWCVQCGAIWHGDDSITLPSREGAQPERVLRRICDEMSARLTVSGTVSSIVVPSGIFQSWRNVLQALLAGLHSEADSELCSEGKHQKDRGYPCPECAKES